MAAVEKSIPKHQMGPLGPGTHGQHHCCHGDAESENMVEWPFVGRLGGNQQFTASASTHVHVIRKTPDAGSSLLWKESFDLRLFLEPELLKQALFEGWGKCFPKRIR